MVFGAVDAAAEVVGAATLEVDVLVGACAGRVVDVTGADVAVREVVEVVCDWDATLEVDVPVDDSA